MVSCLEQGANDMHMVQLMPPPPIVSCFIKIQNGFTFLVPACSGFPQKEAVKWVSVCLKGGQFACVKVFLFFSYISCFFCIFQLLCEFVRAYAADCLVDYSSAKSPIYIVWNYLLHSAVN